MNDFYVVIDAGHGGSDPGTVANGLQEKDLTLQISKYMYDRFKALGVPVTLTRSTDETLSSTERVRRIMDAYGNRENVILISNHINSSGTPNTAEGAEVIYALRNEDTLAKNILNALAREGQVVRKVYQRASANNPNRDYYFIHRETGRLQPLIIEYGFINNQADINRVRNNYRRYVDAIVDAVIQTEGGTPSTPVTTDTHVVKAGETLWEIARMHNLTVDELKQMNNLTSNIISIGQVLKVSGNNNMPNATGTYTVKPGDTLWEIARMYNMSVDQLKQMNNLTSNVISIGQVLNVSSNTTSNPSQSTPPSVSGQTYTVQAGDTLWKIANMYDTTVDELIRLNNLSSNILSVGQVLKVSNNASIPNEYIVKPGDSLYKIANEFGITVDALKAANNLTSNVILIGQVLQIPKTRSYRNNTPFIYKVKTGDTLWSIAKSNNTTVEKIMEVNNLDNDMIMVGQLLIIS